MSMRYPAGFISAFYNPLKNPDAPTIGTATGGIASASVTFTAPVNVGGGAITGYSIVAIKTSDGSITVTTGASSPISVTSLAGTAYTFKVFATNSYGPSPLSAASNSVTPLVIGGALGGGYFAGQISTAGNGVADYNLVVGPVASAQSTLQWKLVNTSTAGTTSVINGPANSTAMNDATHPAAQFCEGLTIGGFSDWYMPAINELEVCYYNLKPSTTTNNTGGGANPNAVPARASNYTSGNPAQTSAADFRTGTGAEAYAVTAPLSYAPGAYWSSTDNTTNYARGMGFDTGYGQAANNFTYKNTSLRVRAIRRVAV